MKAWNARLPNIRLFNSCVDSDELKQMQPEKINKFKKLPNKNQLLII